MSKLLNSYTFEAKKIVYYSVTGTIPEIESETNKRFQDLCQ